MSDWSPQQIAATKLPKRGPGAQRRLQTIIGERFNRLLVTGVAKRPRGWMLVCECECGGAAHAFRSELTSGRVQSCGCLRRETTRRMATKHGHAKPGQRSPEYRAWAEMVARCEVTSRINFKDYGARGITICDRWRYGDGSITAFECFLSDMGSHPIVGSELDRINNDGNYEPGNCRWTTRKQQTRNTRANRIVDIYGQPVSLAQAVEEMSPVSYQAVSTRLHRGWSEHDAILVPKGGKPGDADFPCEFGVTRAAETLTVVA